MMDHIECLPERVDRRDCYVCPVHSHFQEVIYLRRAGAHECAAAGGSGRGELDGIGIQRGTGAQCTQDPAAASSDVVMQAGCAWEIPLINMGMTGKGNIHIVLFQQSFQPIAAQEEWTGGLKRVIRVKGVMEKGKLQDRRVSSEVSLEPFVL